MEPMYDYLVGVDQDGNFDPTQGVAYKWEMASDKLSWAFYIRDGVKFHNGDPLTIEDVKYTIEQAGSKKCVALSRSDFQANVERVEAVPPNKVIVHLKKPWPTILYILSTRAGTEGMIQPKQYIEEKGDDYFKSHPIGSGPYKFFEWKEGIHIKLVAQDSHWRVGVPKYKYLTFKLIPEEGTRAAALRSGEVDVAETSLTMSTPLKKAGSKLQTKKDALHVGLLWIKAFPKEYPISKSKVRKALIYAINKEAIVKQILQGHGKLVGNATCMFTWSIEYKPYEPTPYDPDAAKRLLAEAGYPDGFPINLYSFETYFPEIKRISEAIAGYWEAIGVKVKILEMEYSAFRPVWSNHQEPPGPAAFAYAWQNRPVYSWRNMYHSTATFGHIRDPQMDRMIEEFESKSTTIDKYISNSQRLMEYVLDKSYSTGICTADVLFANDKKIPDWEMGKGVTSYRWEYIGK
jgi:peptide/nickel transport system substrate-binding protein